MGEELEEIWRRRESVRRFMKIGGVGWILLRKGAEWSAELFGIGRDAIRISLIRLLH